MNDLKECITSQDYVETFDKLENAGITEVRIAFSDLFEREDDGKRSVRESRRRGDVPARLSTKWGTWSIH